MDSFPDQQAVADALRLVLEAHRRWHADEPGGVRLDLAGAYLADAYMVGANMTSANMVNACMFDADMTGVNMTGAYMAGAYMAGVNMTGAHMFGACMTGADMFGATLPQGIVRSIAPEAEPEPEAAPAAAERRRIVWFKRYDNRNGTLVLYARDQDGRVWWLVLHADAPDTWTEVTPLPTYQEQP